MAKTTERKLGRAVMQVLATRPNGEALVRTLIKYVPDYVNLSDDDKLPSKTRPNEKMWEQRVRNLKSHHSAEGNVINDGFVEHVGRGKYRLTDTGLAHLKAKNLV